MSEATKRLPALPAERALKMIAGRWKAVILYHLFDGPRRLSELKRLVPEVSQKVLMWRGAGYPLLRNENASLRERGWFRSDGRRCVLARKHSAHNE